MRINVNMNVELKDVGAFKKLMIELSKLKLENAQVLDVTATNKDEEPRPIPTLTPIPKKVQVRTPRNPE